VKALVQFELCCQWGCYRRPRPPDRLHRLADTHGVRSAHASTRAVVANRARAWGLL